MVARLRIWYVLPSYFSYAVLETRMKRQPTSCILFLCFLTQPPDLQILFDSDVGFCTRFCPGPQAGPLHESPSPCVVHGPGCRHAPLWVFASRCENGDVFDRPGYLHGRPEEHAHMSTQPRVLQCKCYLVCPVFSSLPCSREIR